AHLSVSLGQLKVQPRDAPSDAATSIPCEDIGVVLIDHPGVSYSHQALATLVEHGATVVICGNDHLPAGLLLPISTHTQVVTRLYEQINAGKPIRKRLWQQLVKAKILNQSAQLAEDETAQRKLQRLARDVKSGDPQNAEAQAARIYWDTLRRCVPVMAQF